MAIMLIAMPARAAVMKGYVLVNGDRVEAEYTKLSETTAAVGSGKNACIPQYTAGHLTIPGEVTISGTTYTVIEVSSVAFRFCSKITGVEIQENIKRVGNFAFVGCSSLAEIILPASLESLGSGAFINTVSNQTAARVTCLAETPPRWEYNDVFAFHSLGISDPSASIIPVTVDIYVPEGKEETYRSTLFTNPDIGWTGADGWGAFARFYTGVSSVHIYRPIDLQVVREIVNNQGKYNFYKSIYIENDIDMAGIEWDWGIGNNETHPFEGNFYGNGNTISNLKVHNPNGPAGLFSYYGGKTVEKINLKNIDAQGSDGVGAFAGIAGYCDYIGVWVEGCSYKVTDGHMGGILGKCLTTGGANFNQCVVKDIADIEITQPVSGPAKKSGGIVGTGFGGNVLDCAVISSINSDHVNPFVGSSESDNVFFVNDSYAIDRRYANHTPADNVAYNDKVILWGQKSFDVKYSNGREENVAIDSERKFASLMMIPALGLDDWVYSDERYPLPLVFEDKIPVEVNKAIYRPMSSESRRVNGLMLGSGTPWNVFLDNTDTGYRTKTFFTHKLWIDDDFPYNKETPVLTPYPGPYLPIGPATIKSWTGVRYDRTLAVTPAGTKPYTVPNVKVDGEGKPVTDSDGNYVADGETTLYEVPVFTPTAYSVYLPYQLHHNYTFRLFEPEDVTIYGHEANVVVNEIDAETIYPWTPYYLVVTGTPVNLSTDEPVTIDPEPANSSLPFGPDNDYQECGTKNPLGFEDRIFVLSDLDKFSKATEPLPAWRAYFNVPFDIMSMSITRELRFYENIDNNITIEDFDQTRVKATLRGRTFVKDGTWYTLCLPFDLSGNELGPLADATICTLDGCTLADGTLSVTFRQVDHIEAGVPYIVKWEPGINIENPSFYNVKIKDVDNQIVKAGPLIMSGTYTPVNLLANQHALYLGDNNRLYRPDRDMTVNAFRALFYYDYAVNIDALSAIRMNVIMNPATAIDEVKATRATDTNWYSIDGRVLNHKPSVSGIYIHEGKKVIIR